MSVKGTCMSVTMCMCMGMYGMGIYGYIYGMCMSMCMCMGIYGYICIWYGYICVWIYVCVSVCVS